MKKLLLFVGLTFAVGATFAQQDVQVSQNVFNQFPINPAVAGSNDAICATLIGRQQWTGFEGKPETFIFNVNGSFTDPIFRLNRHGAGISIIRDKLGQESTLGLKASYAYRHPLGPNGGFLSGGFSIGFVNKSFSSDWRESDGTPNNDPSIPYGGASDTGFDLDFGLYYKIPGKLYFGISATHLTQSDLSKTGETLISGQEAEFKYGVARHYYIMAGYTQPVMSGQLDLKPNVLVKADGKTTAFDIGMLAEYKKKFWGGLAYRLNDAVVPMVGMNYQFSGKGISGGMLKVGYSYDVTTSDLRNHSSGSHEVMLRYCFKIVPVPKITRHRTVRSL